MASSSMWKIKWSIYLFLISFAHSSSPPKFSTNDLPKILNFQSSSTAQQSQLIKAIIPEYLLAILNSVNSSSNFGETLRRDWFYGVSPVCQAHVAEWVTRLSFQNWGNIANEENAWVLQMVDAWGKIPEGILAGHLASYGDFDECVQIDVKNLNYNGGNIRSHSRQFDGLYCSTLLVDFNTAMSFTPDPPNARLSILQKYKSVSNNSNTIQEAVSLEELLRVLLGIKPVFPPLLPMVGVCFPNSCTSGDVQWLMVNGMLNFYLQIPFFKLEDGIWPATFTCTDRHKPDLDAGAISVITLLAILIGLALSAGILDYWVHTRKTEKQSMSSLINTKIYKYFMAFSAYTNTKKLLSTRKTADDLGCLHGIRFLSMAWVVLGHTYERYMGGPSWNMIDVHNVYKRWTELTVINATFSVDTFFVMTGLLTTYNILKTLEKTKGKLNVPLLYLHRYIRITPTYAIIIGVTTTLFTYTGNGPMWFYYDAENTNCRTTWWTNLLYINNLVHTDKMCYGEAWYLANDMQFFILSPLIIYPIWKWERIGVALLTFYTILSWLGHSLLVIVADKAPALVATRPEIFGQSVTDIYYRPWIHISTFFAGVWAGWILFKTRGKRLKLSTMVVGILWIASTGTALAVVYGIFAWHDPSYKIPKVSGAFYAGLSRFSWAVAVSWVMLACIKGRGGIVNKFLSWSVFMPLGRLCFCVYLTAFHLQGLFHARLTVPIKYDTYTMVNIYFAHLVMACIVGFFCTLLLESPFIIIVKLLLEGVGQGSRKKIETKQIDSAVVKKDDDEQESENNNVEQDVPEKTNNTD